MGIIAHLFGRTTAPNDIMHDVASAVLTRMPDANRISLVKLVYLVQVVHLGRNGRRAFGDWFMATAMGPYNEDLSRAAARLISQRGAGRTATGEERLDAEAIAAVEEVCAALRDATAGEINAAATRPGGAWRRLWTPDPASLMSIADPARPTTRRRPVDKGPIIGIAEMLIDFETARSA